MKFVELTLHIISDLNKPLSLSILLNVCLAGDNKNGVKIPFTYIRKCIDHNLETFLTHKGKQPVTERLQHHSNLIATLKTNQKTLTTAQQR